MHLLRIHPFQAKKMKDVAWEKHPLERQNVMAFSSQVPLFSLNIRFLWIFYFHLIRSIKQTSFAYSCTTKAKAIVDWKKKENLFPYLGCNVGWNNREQQLLLVLLLALQLHPGRDALLRPLESQLVRRSVHAIKVDPEDVSTNNQDNIGNILKINTKLSDLNRPGMNVNKMAYLLFVHPKTPIRRQVTWRVAGHGSREVPVDELPVDCCAVAKCVDRVDDDTDDGHYGAHNDAAFDGEWQTCVNCDNLESIFFNEQSGYLST